MLKRRRRTSGDARDDEQDIVDSPLNGLSQANGIEIGAAPTLDPKGRRKSFSSRFRSRTRSTPPTPPQAPSQSSSTLPLLLTFFVPLASYITGGDLLKEIVLLLFLIFYLHQLIKVPWELYTAARARHRPPILRPAAPPSDQTEDEDSPDLSSPSPTPAQSHLHALELTYLALSILSPLFGSLLLRSVTASFGLTSLSWFSTSLFAFIASLRPWNHLVERLMSHTEALHDTVGEELAVGLVEEPEEDSEDEEREQERQEMKEKIQQVEVELEEAKVAATLMEKRVWKLERTSSRDRNRLEVLEAKYQELLHIVSVQAQERRQNPTRLQPLTLSKGGQKQLQGRRVPNPFFHPLLFLTALFWFLLTPLASIFPSFASSRYKKAYQFSANSPTAPTSPTHKSRIRLQRTGSTRLETVPESDEEFENGIGGSEDEIGSQNSANLETTPEIDVDDASTSDDEFPSEMSTGTSFGVGQNASNSGSGTQIAESSSISDIVVYTPARAAYGFVTGILKHGL